MVTWIIRKVKRLIIAVTGFTVLAIVFVASVVFGKRHQKPVLEKPVDRTGASLYSENHFQ